MSWVIAWKPYSPSGMFVHRIGNLAEGEYAVIARHRLANAMKFESLAAAQMFYDSVAEMKGHEYLKQWVIVNTEDHDVHTSK